MILGPGDGVGWGQIGGEKSGSNKGCISLLEIFLFHEQGQPCLKTKQNKQNSDNCADRKWQCSS